MTKLALLRGVKTLPQLANVLGVQPQTLSYVLYWMHPNLRYNSFYIPKKSGGKRLIAAPAPQLKIVQTKLSHLLLEIQAELERARTLPQCVLSHGFKADLSIITNARMHRNKRHVFNIDLQDFFPSINFCRVFGFFLRDRNFILHPKVATLIAQIACFNNELPQGSPCSPVVSNYIAHILDIHLNKIATSNRCSYTRYVDDITFSTNEETFPPAIAELKHGTDDQWIAGNELIRVVYNSGFQINHLKTRMQLQNSRQDVTGLVVNRKVNVREEYYKLARVQCFHLFRNGYFYFPYDLRKMPASERSLDGIMNYIYSVKRINTQNWKNDQRAFWSLYRKYLDYRSFYSNIRPIIVCEGKTDNIYLRAAIRSLHIKFPSFFQPGPKQELSVDFFNYSEASARFQDLSGGTGEMNKLIASYRSRMSSFKFGFKEPVIMIIDNDEGSKGLFKQLGGILGKTIGGLDPFYYVFLNLYVVPIPKSGVTAAIEDLFDTTLLDSKLDGRAFDRSGKAADLKKWYGKIDFATKIVKPQRKSINFTNFEPLLAAITEVRADYAAKMA